MTCTNFYAPTCTCKYMYKEESKGGERGLGALDMWNLTFLKNFFIKTPPMLPTPLKKKGQTWICQISLF